MRTFFQYLVVSQGRCPIHYLVRQECERRTLRSEEHTSELQSLRHLVCRLLLEKKTANRSTANSSPSPSRTSSFSDSNRSPTTRRPRRSVTSPGMTPPPAPLLLPSLAVSSYVSR